MAGEARDLIDPCPVAYPQKKGRVESGVKYVKSNFVPLRDFHSLVQANELLHTFLMGEAGNRIHGSRRERPLKLFTETEQRLLQALPAMVPECATWEKAKLYPKCHVQFAYCHYSAPFALISQTLWLEITPHALCIHRDHELVATYAQPCAAADLMQLQKTEKQAKNQPRPTPENVTSNWPH